jgi:hypothetical protein
MPEKWSNVVLAVSGVVAVFAPAVATPHPPRTEDQKGSFFQPSE